jgi:putative tricarboxylic transport membrane protein
MRFSRRLQTAAPYAVVLAAGGFLYYSADHLAFAQTPGRIGPDAWPKLILILMMATAVWGLIAAVLRRPTNISAEAEIEQIETLVRPPEVFPHLVWIGVFLTLGYVFALPVLGYFIASVIYVGAIMFVGHYRRMLYVSMFSLVVPLIFMFLFMRVVYVSLPLGIGSFKDVTLMIMSLIGVR